MFRFGATVGVNRAAAWFMAHRVRVAEGRLDSTTGSGEAFPMEGDHDLYHGDFERDGEETVRNRVVLKVYQGKTYDLAVAWLERRDQARRDASQAEQTEIDRSAKDAAWESAKAARDAAREAKTANRIATLALIVAAIAIAISIIGFFIPAVRA